MGYLVILSFSTIVIFEHPIAIEELNIFYDNIKWCNFVKNSHTHYTKIVSAKSNLFFYFINKHTQAIYCTQFVIIKTI